MSLFRADHYFCIGDAHVKEGKPCQDYAISDIMQNAAFAIVSDGCSAGGHTDIGARMMTLGTARAIRRLHDNAHGTPIDVSTAAHEIFSFQQIFLEETTRLLGVSFNDMLATCIYAYLEKSFGFIHILGDGAAVLMLPGGELEMHLLRWKKNMPFYPAYASLANIQTFVLAHGEDENEKSLTEEIWIRNATGEFTQRAHIEHSVKSGICGITIPLSFHLSCHHANTGSPVLGIFSDGIGQVDGVDWKDVVVSLLAYKTTTGEFMKRRAMRALKEFRKSGKILFDDIGCAAICFDESEAEPTQ